MSNRSNPFNEFERLIEQMQENFEQVTQKWGMETLPTASSARVDLEDTGETLVLSADIPGFQTEEIDVTLVDQELRIDAEHEGRADIREDDSEYVRRERRRTSVSRRVRLPTPVDADEIEASYNNGVLTVEMPKLHEETSGKNIDIN